jgi:hypothetical protein
MHPAEESPATVKELSRPALDATDAVLLFRLKEYETVMLRVNLRPVQELQLTA